LQILFRFHRQTSPAAPTGRGTRNQQVGWAGEYFVFTVLIKHGAFTVLLAGSTPKFDLRWSFARSLKLFMAIKQTLASPISLTAWLLKGFSVI